MAEFDLSRKKKALHLRARLIQMVRRFFIDQDFLEVETPIRIPAPAPEAHIDAFPSESWFLQTSPELCLKRMLAAGYPRLFQICKCFRKNERGQRHLPEFTLLEWYCAESNYLAMMDQTRELIRCISSQFGNGDTLTYQGHIIDLKPPWPKMTVAAAFAHHASQSLPAALQEKRFDELLALEIEPCLVRERPLFLYDYPAIHAALARMKPDNDRIAQRFELYIAGMELCNGFTELTDAAEQRNRFVQERTQRRMAGRTVYPMPEKFLKDLNHLSNAAGNAMGIDRLVMLFADTPDIQDVVAFTPETV
jgi:lysyl-tRNA synthetase class 2